MNTTGRIYSTTRAYAPPPPPRSARADGPPPPPPGGARRTFGFGLGYGGADARGGLFKRATAAWAGFSARAKLIVAAAAVAVVAAIALAAGPGRSGYNESGFLSYCNASQSTCQCELHYMEQHLTPAQFNQGFVNDSPDTQLDAAILSEAQGACGV